MACIFSSITTPNVCSMNKDKYDEFLHMFDGNDRDDVDYYLKQIEDSYITISKNVNKSLSS